MWLKILSHWRVAKELRYAAKKSQELVSHNTLYPESPKDFPEWENKLQNILNDAYTRFS